MLTAIFRWIDRNLLELGREMRLSYLPPLMVYCAAGVSGLTGIVGTFFVKDYLGLSASFLAALGFWAVGVELRGPRLVGEVGTGEVGIAEVEEEVPAPEEEEEPCWSGVVVLFSTATTFHPSFLSSVVIR